MLYLKQALRYHSGLFILVIFKYILPITDAINMATYIGTNTDIYIGASLLSI